MSKSDASTDNLDPEAGFTASPSVSQAANDLRHAAGDKAKDLMNTAEVKAAQLRQTAAEKATAFKTAATTQASQLKDSANEQWEHTRVKAKEYHTTAEDYIRENPTKSVLCAMGIGFLAGLVMRRWFCSTR